MRGKCSKCWCGYEIDMEQSKALSFSESTAQSCCCCGKTVYKTPMGVSTILFELFDEYGRHVLCRQCFKHHYLM